MTSHVHENRDVRLVREALDNALMAAEITDHNSIERLNLAGEAALRLEARIEELERERNEARGAARAYEARVERLEEALRWYDDHKSQDGSYDGDLFGDLNAVALAEQPPAENTDFAWKTQEC